MKSVFLVLLSVLFVFQLSNCKRERPDKCDKAIPLSAGFAMQEDPQDPKFSSVALYDTDTAGWLGVRFTADEPEGNGITYTWRVGADPKRWTTRSFYLLFADFYQQGGKDVDVWLTVRKPQNDCFPGDTVKTIVRKLYFKPGTKVKGYFEGTFSNDPDTKKTVYINPDTTIIDNGFPYTGFYFEGFPVFSPLSAVNTDFDEILRLRALNSKAGPASSTTGEKGHFWIDCWLETDNKTLRIEIEAIDKPYSQWKVGDPIIKKRYSFTGKKIN